jgi:signal transduction histidine kinase
VAADNLAGGVVVAPEQIRQYGVLLRQQARRLATTIEQTLLFASYPKYDLRRVEVADVVARAVAVEREFIEAAGVAVENRIAAALPAVLADPVALGRCIENLLSNALKYASQGLWIGIRAEIAAAELRITIADHGPGISPAEQAQLFEPFYRGAAAREAQISGSGLGLNLVRQTVEAMGGRISIYSRPGEGSAFTLHLKVAGE